MAEKIHPSSKQPTGAPPNPAFTTTTKPNIYNPTRPVYRPQPRRSRRSCCCSLCLWVTFTLLILILLAAAAGGVFYVMYRPHRPSFTVTSLHVNQFNLTSTKLNSKFNFTVMARNPNKKIEFGFDPVNVKVSSDGVDVGDGTVPAFFMGKKNSTRLKAVVSANDRTVDNNNNNGNGNGDGDINKVRSDLKSKKSLPLTIRLDTKVKVKIGSLKTKAVPVKVVCVGIKFTVPTGKSGTTAVTSNVNCKVDLRIKIWKWTV